MQTILLLHGALGSKDELEPLERTLAENFIVHSLNFYGHGGEPTEQDFSIEDFSRQVLDWLKEKALETVTIIGYSLGGYVGLYLARNYPQKINKLVTLGTKLYWDASVAEKEIAKLDPATITARFPAFADSLQKLHGPSNWTIVLRKTAAMLKHIGQFNTLQLEDYRQITTPILLLLGDRDKLVSFVETTTVYKELTNGVFAVLPNTRHAIAELNVTLVACVLKTFLLQQPA